MKIVFDYEIFYQQKYGGISTYFTNLGLELLKKNIDINFICPIHKNYNLKKLPKKIVLGKRFIYPSSFNYLVSKINSSLSNAYYNSLKPTIIHKTYFSDNKPNHKFINIITFYDITHELNNIKTQENEKIKSLKKNNILAADHIICPSNRVKDDLINYLNINKDKISVTHFSSDYKKISTLVPSQEKKMQNHLLYVGNRSGYKNFENFVSAFANSKRLQKDFKILVFGGEKPSVCGIDLILKKGLSVDSFEFVHGTNEDLEYLYRNVRALIYTSAYEGFGIPLIEAMRSGCPIVTSNGGALEEVGGSELSYFDPSNVEELQQQIEDTVYSTDKLIKTSIYGLKRSDDFSWSSCAEKTLEIYKKLL